MRTIAVLTTCRADYSICRPVMRAIAADPDLALLVLAGDTHLAADRGTTVGEIRADGFELSDVVETTPRDDTPASIADAMGRATASCASIFSRCRPDLLLLTGDRFETMAAASAAVPFLIPVLHVHGGEVTEGAMDDAFRHAITKLAHLHAVSTPEYARRVRQLGEEPWRVRVTGAPGLDNMRSVPLLAPASLLAALSLAPEPAPLVVTYHPVTLEPEQNAAHLEALLTALESTNLPLVFTAPNTDQASGAIRDAVVAFVETHRDARFVPNLGPQRYCSLMRCAAAMVGNSSSGIIEASSFGLPVVNVGNRQRGRVRGRNVIDTANDGPAIREGIRRAVTPSFRAALAGMTNPYGDGHAAERIVAWLKTVQLDKTLTTKRFTDLSQLFAREETEQANTEYKDGNTTMTT